MTRDENGKFKKKKQSILLPVIQYIALILSVLSAVIVVTSMIYLSEILQEFQKVDTKQEIMQCIDKYAIRS